jgi:hypothetical protein
VAFYVVQLAVVTTAVLVGGLARKWSPFWTIVFASAGFSLAAADAFNKGASLEQRLLGASTSGHTSLKPPGFLAVLLVGLGASPAAGCFLVNGPPVGYVFRTMLVPNSVGALTVVCCSFLYRTVTAKALAPMTDLSRKVVAAGVVYAAIGGTIFYRPSPSWWEMSNMLFIVFVLAYCLSAFAQVLHAVSCTLRDDNRISMTAGPAVILVLGPNSYFLLLMAIWTSSHSPPCIVPDATNAAVGFSGAPPPFLIEALGLLGVPTVTVAVSLLLMLSFRLNLAALGWVAGSVVAVAISWCALVPEVLRIGTLPVMVFVVAVVALAVFLRLSRSTLPRAEFRQRLLRIGRDDRNRAFSSNQERLITDVINDLPPVSRDREEIDVDNACQCFRRNRKLIPGIAELTVTRVMQTAST